MTLNFTRIKLREELNDILTDLINNRNEIENTEFFYKKDAIRLINMAISALEEADSYMEEEK